MVPGDEFVFVPNMGPIAPPSPAPASATSTSTTSVAASTPPQPPSPAPPPPPPPPPPLLVRATGVRRYETFAAMLQGEGVGACLPGVAGLAEGVAVYRAIPGYAAQEAAGLGVVGVGLELVAATFEEGQG